MSRRPRLAVFLLVLVVFGSVSFGSPPTDHAFGADPLTDAQNHQRELQQTLAAQRRDLANLQAQAATLNQRLNDAKTELASVSAEYERVSGLLTQVEAQIADVTAKLEALRARIATLDDMLVTLAIDVERQNRELEAREALLQDHYRDAYEQSQTSLLEVLLAADSFESVATHVGYLMTVSEQDAALADDIRVTRARLESSRATLREGRAELADSRDQEEAEAATLQAQQQQLSDLQAQLAQLKAQAEQKRAQQEAALNAALAAQGNVQQQIAANQAAAAAAAALVSKLLAESHVQISSRGFRWPEDNFIVTQEWGPTSFTLEPPYTYNGHYYPHFHGGIDIAHGCGTPIHAAGSGVVVASGQPLWPSDPGYGVVIDHGGGVMTWYWHLRAQVVVHPGQGVSIGDVIGYEGNTGWATGCHLHFAVNDHGVWTNPRWYLP